MPFTTNMSGTTQFDDSIVLAYEKQFLITVGEETNMDEFASYQLDPGAKSIQLTKYNRLAVDTAPLTETDDVTSEAASDSQILITPAEYGKAVTKTALASFQTGGKIDLAIPELVAHNLVQLKSKLAVQSLEASTNVLFAGSKTEPTLTSSDIITGNLLNVVYNKLSRANVPTINGLYVAVMHDDVIHDLRQDSGWVTTVQYQNSEKLFKNEVGTYRGFRIIRNNFAYAVDQSGAGLVDVYKSSFFGANAFGLVESKTPELTITGPFDKLGRFVNVGWHGIFKYQIVDTDAVWQLQTASSVGANAV